MLTSNLFKPPSFNHLDEWYRNIQHLMLKADNSHLMWRVLLTCFQSSIFYKDIMDVNNSVYRAFLEKLIVTQLEINSLLLWNLNISCSKKPTTGPHPEPSEFSPHFHILFLQHPF
jgi:hypothetical protein